MGGSKLKKPKSHKGRPPYEGDYPPPPMPWQTDPENNKKPDFGKDYKEWYDRNAGIEPERESDDIPKTVPKMVSDMVQKHMQTVQK